MTPDPPEEVESTMLPDRRDDEYAMASQLRAAGESLRAVEVLERYLAEDPRDSRAQTLLAICYDDVGQQARALEVVQDILAQDVSAEHRAGLHQLQALCLEQLSRFREACAVLRMALRSAQVSRTQRANLLMLLGLTLQQRGRAKEARKALRSALALDPGNDEVQFHLCVACRSSQPRRTQLVLEGMMTLGDEDEAVLREVALSYHLLGRPDKAASLLEHRRAQRPLTRGFLSYFFLKSGVPEKALDLATAGGEDHHPLEEWCIQLGRAEAGDRAVVGAVRVEPALLTHEDPRADWEFLRFLRDVGEVQSARSMGLRLLERCPDHPYGEWIANTLQRTDGSGPRA